MKPRSKDANYQARLKVDAERRAAKEARIRAEAEAAAAAVSSSAAAPIETPTETAPPAETTSHATQTAARQDETQGNTPKPSLLSNLQALLTKQLGKFQSAAQNNGRQLMTAGIAIAAIATVVGLIAVASYAAGGLKKAARYVALPFVATYDAARFKLKQLFGRKPDAEVNAYAPSETDTLDIETVDYSSDNALTPISDTQEAQSPSSSVYTSPFVSDDEDQELTSTVGLGG